MKREDYLTWDEYFMGIALLSAMRSKDPSTQVGACIVDEQKKILSDTKQPYMDTYITMMTPLYKNEL